MKKSEIITKYAANLAETMVNRFRAVLDSAGNVQYAIYIWEDGEIECREQVQGDHGYLKPADGETRALYYVDTIMQAYFDPWDYVPESKPEDPAEAEEREREIIDYLVDQYRQDIDVTLDSIIADAEREEKYDA